METRQQELYSGVLSEATVVDWGTMGPGEEWVNTTTHREEQGVFEAEEEMLSELNSSMTEEEREEIQQQLARLDEEISTLRQVLASKEKQHADLKQRLGISPLSEMKNNFSKSWQDMQTSTTYKRTSESLTTAGQKTSAAFSTLGTALSRTFGDMSMFGLELLYPRRSHAIGNSPSFKSFEEKVETTVTNIKTRVGSPGSGGSFEDVLSSAAQSSSQDTLPNDVTDGSDRPC